MPRSQATIRRLINVPVRVKWLLAISLILLLILLGISAVSHQERVVGEDQTPAVPAAKPPEKSFATNAKADSIPEGRTDLLSVRETMGVIYYSATGMDLTHCLPHTNSQALPILRRVLQSKYRRDTAIRAWEVLGYVGNADDVTRLRSFLFHDTEGDLHGMMRDQVRAAFHSLGVFCRRNVPGAIAMVDELSREGAWTKVKYRWIRQGVPSELTETQHNMVALLAGYALSGRSDIEDRCREAIDSITVKEQRTAFEQFLQSSIGRSRERIELEKRAVTAEERHLLSRGWNGDTENPGPAADVAEPPSKQPPVPSHIRNKPEPKPLGDSHLLLKTAVSEFAAACERVRSEDVEQLAARLLDDARPIKPTLRDSMTAELRYDLPRLRQIIDDESVKSAKPTNATMTHDDANDEQGNVTIRYELVGTKKLGFEVYSNGGFHTVAKSGNLVVLLRRIDGVWFWNPFGW
jgi:hypothetical protein